MRRTSLVLAAAAAPAAAVIAATPARAQTPAPGPGTLPKERAMIVSVYQGAWRHGHVTAATQMYLRAVPVPRGATGGAPQNRRAAGRERVLLPG